MITKVKPESARYIVAAGFFAWAFFAPWGITGAEIGLAVVLLGTILEALTNRELPQPKVGWAPAAFFLIWAFVSASEIEPPAYENLARLWVILMFFVSSIHLNGHIRSKDVLTLFLLSLTVCAVYSIIQHYTGLDLMHHDTQEKYLKLVKNWRYQVIGTYSHHLTLANVMLAGAVLAFSRVVGSRGKARLLWLTSALLMTTAMLFTFTHGPLLGLVAALVFLAAATNPKRALPILGGLALLVAVLFAVSYNIRYFFLVQWAEKVHVERLFLWKASLKLVWQHPLFGVGAGNFRDSIEPVMKAMHYRFTSRSHAHNSFLQYAVEFGIPGALFVLWFFASILLRGAKALASRKIESDERFLLAGCLAAVFGLMVSAMTQHVFGDSEVALVAWLLCGVISAKIHDESKSANAESLDETR